MIKDERTLDGEYRYISRENLMERYIALG